MKRKSRKVFSFFLLISFLLIFILLIGYFLLAFYYRQGFTVNTWINGVYCTGKSVEEVNAELLSRVEAPIVIITDEDGIEYEINMASADYREEYLSMLQKYMEEQNPYLWIDNVTFHRNHELFPQIYYDINKLKEIFGEMPPIQEELQKEPDYFIAWNAVVEGYKLYDHLSKRMDVDKAFELLVAAIDAGERQIDLSSLDCYYDIPLTEEQEQTKLLWEKIDYFQNCDLIYDMGAEKIEFTSEITSGLLEGSGEYNNIPILDENGELVLSPEAVERFVQSLANEYDTYGIERRFNSTRGDVITLEKGTYGTTLDQKAEVTYLMENLLSPDMHTGEIKEHIPEYKREAFVRGKDDIGGTYIEIDMTAQKLYYYVDREMVIETDVVTGNMRRKMDTPAGVYFVYGKQEDRVLRGQGYATPVEYWMPVNGNIGIHDADWRSEFGGEIYKTNGSHGCVNVPPEVMPQLYERVEIGTPVIMFY
ncbi:MAG: hypothetical protein E7291_02135 [Lachnospiraceae bacterium]|nr:hypothetical protein [Lachnospiraceae bacterium]